MGKFSALDFKTDENYLSAYVWINSLSFEAVASLRKLRISTFVLCQCESAFEARAKGGYCALSSKGSINFAISINRNCEESSGVSMDFCEHCDERPVTTAAHANRILATMELEDEDSAVSRTDLLALFKVFRSLDDLDSDE